MRISYVRPAIPGKRVYLHIDAYAIFQIYACNVALAMP